VSTVDDLVLPAPFTTGDVLVRAASVEDVDPDKGTVDVIVMTYNKRAQIDDQLFEEFSPGAFKAVCANPSRVKISDQQHDRKVVVGQAIELRDEPKELRGTLRIADTAAGRDLLTLMTPGKNGEPAILEELSIEFRAQPRHFKVTRSEQGLLVRHDRAVLVGISPVSAGAYANGSRVLAVREDARNRQQERAIAELSAMTSGTDLLAGLR
jgi:HK97 family phage prohead protease